jgi:mycothiol synthase
LSTQANLLIRNFKWSDLDALQQLLNDVGRHGHRDWASNVEELRSELESPRVKPKRNIAVLEENDELVGYAIVEPETNIGRSVIGIGSSNFGLAIRKRLIDWATNRAKAEAPIAHLSTRDSEIELEKLVEQLGWAKVRKYLKLETTSDLKPANAVIPNGFSLRTMLGLDEVPEVTYLQNTVFNEHFGYSPNTEDEIKAHLMAPGASVDDIVMIHDSYEQLVAYCWTQIHDRDGSKVGRIGMTGVLPAARKNGLGRAIAEAGYNHLLKQNVASMELDVDSENVPAIRVYSSIGFAESSQVNWWERSL